MDAADVGASPAARLRRVLAGRPAARGPSDAYPSLTGFGVLDGPDHDRCRPRHDLLATVQQHAFGDVIRRTVTGEVRFGF